MIANLCLLLAPVLGSSVAIQDPPTPPPQEPAPKPQDTQTPPPEPAPEPKPEPRPEPKPEPQEEPPPQAFTAEPAKPLNTSKLGYTWAQIDIIRGDGDGYGDGPDGFDLHGSYALAQQGVFLFGGVSHLSGNVGSVSPDTNTLTVGVGLHTPVNPSTDFVADVSLMHAHSETQAPPGASDGSGYGLGVGLRHLANEQLEVNGGLLFTDFDDSDSEATLHFGLVYHASPSVGLCTNVSASDDLDTLTLGLRFTP